MSGCTIKMIGYWFSFGRGFLSPPLAEKLNCTNLLIAQIHGKLIHFTNYPLTLKIFVTVPAGLEGVFADLKIEVSEGEMVGEFDNVVVGNDVMLNRKRPKVKKNYICFIKISQ